jgi:hypothetical protein
MVAPFPPISLPTERVKPSIARWATAWRGVCAISGGVASTISRPLGATLRTVSWKKPYSSRRRSEVSMPDAS